MPLERRVNFVCRGIRLDSCTCIGLSKTSDSHITLAALSIHREFQLHSGGEPSNQIAYPTQRTAKVASHLQHPDTNIHDVLNMEVLFPYLVQEGKIMISQIEGNFYLQGSCLC